MAFMYGSMGVRFTSIYFRIFRNGWVDCRDAFHAVVCLYCCVTDRTYTVAEYEVY